MRIVNLLKLRVQRQLFFFRNVLTVMYQEKHFPFLSHFLLRESVGVGSRVSERRLTVFSKAKFWLMRMRDKQK